ncbi:MAG: helix-turn-helix domain-containing protein [Polyangiaceae bacterium]|nr:helix-turn-helix domain-containing protein [Polyangiaceae bacterium]
MSGLSQLPVDVQRPLEKLCLGFERVGYSQDRVLSLIAQHLRPEPAVGQRTVSDYFEAWKIVYAKELPPLCGLHAGAGLPFGVYDVIDVLASSCETVGEGFERIARYFVLVRPGIEYVIDQAAHHPTVRIVDRTRDDDYFFDEWTIGVIFGRFREILAGKFVYAGCSLRRPKPAAPAAIDAAGALLGCDVAFGAKDASISIARDSWDAPLPSRNSRMRDAMERHARELLDEMDATSGSSRRVRELLTEELRGGEPTIERVAKRLATTPRTLQRRLQDENTSFQGELDALRAQLARRYLGDSRLGVSEVAFLLGYADASAFARAFRRWYGKAPAEERLST